MFGLSTDAHKKHIQAVKRILKKNSPESLTSQSLKTLEMFFGGMTVEEIQNQSKEYWSAVVLDFLKFVKKLTNQPLIRVINPTKKVNGYSNHNSILQLASPDMPFIVDSVALAIAKCQHRIDLMTHPVAVLGRTKAGVLKEIKQTASDKESWMHIELNQHLDVKESKILEDELQQIMAKISACVAGWMPMLEKLEQAKEDLSFEKDESTFKKQLKFFNWLKEDNFTFLGY